MSNIVAPNDERKQVSGSRWLLTHWKEIEKFSVINGNAYYFYLPSAEKYVPVDEPNSHLSDAVLIAYMQNGSAFVERWADSSVLLNWLHRPVFKGRPISWFNWHMTIDANPSKTLKNG